jgi:hypothetical protein
MSPWLELLLNVIALAGFVVVATYYRPKGAGAVLDHLCKLQFKRIDGCARANRSSASQK